MSETETKEHVDTRESLLDAAESLFSEHGLAAASLRAITQQAGVNLAAVSYHFGSKEGLVRAVFSRRLKPLNDERKEMLEACDLTAADGLEQVLRAFLVPAVRMIRDAPEGVHGFGRLMGRVFSEPNEEVRKVVFAEFKETVDRFMAAFRVLLPHLSPEELTWRFHFVAGSMAHTIGCGQMLEELSGGVCRFANVDDALAYLESFLSAGLRAPAAAGCPQHSQGD
ncbi:MAG TPA: TetR family transcriptional regulator [Thermoanaerobaculia bacterium]|jgi:AcrR family transcriptional regulator|nr:TetR family transcriptional regulator [Thermoanaerobaculia bacterium]